MLRERRDKRANKLCIKPVRHHLIGQLPPELSSDWSVMAEPPPLEEDTPPSAPEVVVAVTFKVLVLGDSFVGKTSVISYFDSGDTPMQLLPTIGMDFTDVVISVRGTRAKLRIWDTAGQERFFTFTKQFFRGTQGILLVYDITEPQSFHTLHRWIRAITDVGLTNVSIVIVGNKCDLKTREVPKENAVKLAERYGHAYVETSAKTGKNIKKAFYKLAESLIHNYGIFQPGHEADAIELSSDSAMMTTLSNKETTNNLSWMRTELISNVV